MEFNREWTPMNANREMDAELRLPLFTRQFLNADDAGVRGYRNSPLVSIGVYSRLKSS
jgi:hypothetical protein